MRPNPDLVDELALAAQEGDQSALETVLAKTRPLLLHYLRKLQVRKSDMDDLAQDAVIVVMDCISIFNPSKGDFLGLVSDAVLKMIRNTFKNNDCKRMLSLERVPEPSQRYRALDPDTKEALASLSPSRRQLVKEHFGLDGVYDYSISQLAVRHDMSDEQVRKELVESLQYLRKAG